jgi:predicted transcriptional regulator
METTMSAILTVRIKPNLKDRPDQIAKSTNQGRSFLAEEVIHPFVDVNPWHIETNG